MKLKHNPFRLHYEIKSQVKQLPVWYSAMQAVPPAPKPSIQIIPEEAGQFIGKYNSDLGRYCNPKHPIKKKKQFPAYYYKPQEIIYPEDELRELFYAQHPFELHRPRIIVDDEETVWDNIHGTPRQELSGERFVKTNKCDSICIVSKENNRSWT